MSETPVAAKSFPSLRECPVLADLQSEAEDLLGKVRGTPSEAFRTVARRYGFKEWRTLEAYVEQVGAGLPLPLETVIVENDIETLGEMLRDDPNLVHRIMHWSRRRYHNQYQPLAYAAFLGQVDVMDCLLAAGADIDHGPGNALRAATFGGRAAIDLLLIHGASVQATSQGPPHKRYDVVDYAAMILSPDALSPLLDRVEPSPRTVGFILASNDRWPQRKAECLDLMSAAGIGLPESAPMALHRSQRKRLAALLADEPKLLCRRFSEEEIFPARFGIPHPSPYSYVTPLVGGVTLLHMAVEWCDGEMVRWLLECGADVNAVSGIDAAGYGGWTPLFHSVVTLHQPRSFPEIAQMLLDARANPNLRASIRKPTSGGKWVAWEGVTAVSFARGFSETDLVNDAALRLIGEARDS